MNYEERIDAARTCINQHNSAIAEGKSGFVDCELFIDQIKGAGGTNETRLAKLSHEDILECIIPCCKLTGQPPRVLAREIAEIFRIKNEKDDSETHFSSKKVEKMSLEQLISVFDPEDTDSAVGKRLSSISKGQKFIVYSDGRAIDVPNTLKLLQEIKRGFNGREDLDVDGTIKKVYRIGDLPDNYVDENPLYRDRPLRPDGTCDQLGRSWEGINQEIRQFIRVAMDIGALQINHEIAHTIFDMALEPTALTKLKQRYRTAAVTFEDLKKTNKLPSLKILLNRKSGGGLSDGKKIEWNSGLKMMSNGIWTQ